MSQSDIVVFKYVFSISLCVSLSLFICLPAPVLLPVWCLSIYPLPTCILSRLLCPNWKAELIIPYPVLGTSSGPPQRDCSVWLIMLKRKGEKKKKHALRLRMGDVGAPCLNWALNWLIWIEEGENPEHPSSFSTVSIGGDFIELIGKACVVLQVFIFLPWRFHQNGSSVL